MSGYLQRLLDRAAPAPATAPGALPAGLSQSPVSLSDQRLNDPGFADRFEPSSGSDAGFAVASGTEAPARAPGRTRARPPAPDVPTLAMDRGPHLAPPAAPVQTAAPPVPAPSEPAPALPPFPHPISHIAPDDLVLPDPVTDAGDGPVQANPTPVPERPAAAATPTRAEAAPTDPTSLEPASTATPPASDALGTMPEVTPFPPRPRADPTGADPAPEPVPAPNAQLETGPQLVKPRVPAEVTPPPVVAPALPDPPVVAPRQPVPASARQPVKIDEAEPRAEASAPSSERRNRPMTAADASIVGPLTPRRRTVTLFGLRRR